MTNSTAYQSTSQLAQWENEGLSVNLSLNFNFNKTSQFVWVKGTKVRRPNLAPLAHPRPLSLLPSRLCVLCLIPPARVIPTTALPCGSMPPPSPRLRPPTSAAAGRLTGHGGVAPRGRVVGRHGPERPVGYGPAHGSDPLVRRAQRSGTPSQADENKLTLICAKK